jgi:glycosyltransferase involved in cell wall biosynthesis
METVRMNEHVEKRPNGSTYKLSVVIPAYNEEAGIAEILDRVLSIQPELAAVGVEGLEVIVVDDGSRDRTVEIVRTYSTVRLINHAQNRGYGGALKTGFSNAAGNLLAFLDADSTYPPESFPELCQEIINGADLVIGSRMAGAKSEMPRTRRLGNFIFAHLVSLVGNHYVTDSASGMRVFRAETLERLYPLPDGLNFTPVMSTRAIHEGLKMVEVPIAYSERSGRSKLSVVKDGLRFFNSIIWTALSYNPVRILGLIGLAGIGLAALVALMLIVLRANGFNQLGPWGIFAVFSAAVLGVAGVSLFSLGAMFNYLVSLFQKKIEQRGLFGKPIFNPPLDRQFWWIGGLAVIAGFIVGVGTLVLGFNGWTLDRLWLWMLAGALSSIVGVQLIVSGIAMRVLEEVSVREVKQAKDLNHPG